MARVRKRLDSAVVCVLGLFLAVLFVPFSRIGVDPHHDGVMLTPALAVSRGLRVHQDIYAQYGPVSVWAQAFAIRILGDGLFSIRLVSALALVLASLLFYSAWAMAFDRWVALLSVVLWSLCAPFFTRGVDALPWSSDYVLLLQSAATLCLVLAWRTRRTRTSILLLFSCSALVGILIFTRVNTGLATCAVLLTLSVAFLPWKVTRVIAFGIATGFLSILSVLTLRGSSGEWYEQAIVMPRWIYVDILGQSGLDGLRGNAAINALPAAGFMLCVLLVLTRVDKLFHSHRCLNKNVAFSIAAIMCISFCLGWLFKGDGVFNGWNRTTAMFGCGLLGIIFFVFYLPKDTWPSATENKQMLLNASQTRLLTAGIGAASLVQYFPVVDSRHVWWATLPTIAPTLAAMSHFLAKKQLQVAFGLALLLPVGFQSWNSTKETLAEKRYPVPEIPVLKRMLISEDLSKALGTRFEAIADFQKMNGAHPVLNLCKDGLYSSVGQRIDFPDPYYVYWTFKKQMWDDANRVEWVQQKKPFIWICDPLPDPATWVAQVGYRLVPRDVCLEGTDLFKSWPYNSLLAVPMEWAPLTQEAKWLDVSRCSST